MRTWEHGESFLELLLADGEVVDVLGDDGIRDCFDLAHHQRHLDSIFSRVFG
jgi:adenylosuccinate lyase